jgi:hypothetical protein
MIKHLQHDYLKDTLLSIYKECISCKNRTQFTCVKCDIVIATIGRWNWRELNQKCWQGLICISREIPSCYNSNRTINSGRQQMAIDEYGRQIEAICNYRICHHKFLVHGQSTQCKCRHALNYAAEVSLKTGCMIYN